MINDKEHEVPDFTIAAIPFKDFDINELFKIIKPLNENNKRDWFTKDFYKCLPLSIGNQQGFSVSIPFGIDVFWTGGDSRYDLKIYPHEDEKQYQLSQHVNVSSHFGYGIFTVNIPVIFKTPPGINLMTIAPPNHLIPNLMPLTGVIESDNIRYTFTFNIRVSLPGINFRINAYTPVAAFIPIPRYFCDQFKLVDASILFDKKIIDSEKIIHEDHAAVREYLSEMNNIHDRSYFTGTDIRGNSFSDHQLPNRKYLDHE